MLLIPSWMLSSPVLSSDGELPHFLDAVSYLLLKRQSRRRVAFLRRHCLRTMAMTD
jgi:hypothetical protein